MAEDGKEKPVSGVEAAAFRKPLTIGGAALARIYKLAEVIPEDELDRVNVDLTAASVTGLGAWPKIKAARADVVRKLPHHDMTYYDAFEDICVAMGHVQSRVVATEEESRELMGQADNIKETVNVVKNFLVGHAGFGTVNMLPLKKIGSEFGYRALLEDAGVVLELLTENWQTLGPNAPFSEERLHAFDREIEDFRVAVGIKEQDPEGPRAELLLRRRLHTLFRRAVSDIRVALMYTYGEDKVGEYVPGFSNATGKPREAAPKPATPAGQENTSTAPRPSGFVVNNPNNLPITDPFISDEAEGKKAG